jgi:ribonuclease Z
MLMMELHILGTASARPTSTRNVSGSVLSTEEGLVIIDAGEGFQTRYSTQRSMMKRSDKNASLRPHKIAAIALTHGHLDHTWGVLPFLQTLALDGRKHPLMIYGPTSEAILKALETVGFNAEVPENTPSADLINQYRAWFQLGAKSIELGYEVRWMLGEPHTNRWVELNPDASSLKWHEEMPQPEPFKSIRLDALGTKHSVPSCAWQITKAASQGVFDRNRATLAGLKEGERRLLATGTDVEKENGTILKASSFRGPERRAHSFVISGDTAEQSIHPIGIPTVLVHEATFLEESHSKAEEHLHSTAMGAARTAKACGAEHLVLTHFSARIRDASESLTEAKEEYEDAGITYANDGDRLQIDVDGNVTFYRRNELGWKQHNITHH